MEERIAAELIRSYVEGWKYKDTSRILQTLEDECEIVESHGPTYRGIKTIAKWIDQWFAEGSTVDRWEVLSFFHAGNVSIFEWEFACTVQNESYCFRGASVVEFRERISRIREYRMTAEPFDWTPFESG